MIHQIIFFVRYSNGDLGYCPMNTDAAEENCYDSYDTVEKRKTAEDIWYTAYCDTENNPVTGAVEVVFPRVYYFRNSDFQLLKMHEYWTWPYWFHHLGLGGGLRSTGSGMEVGSCGKFCNEEWEGQIDENGKDEI